MTGTRAEDRGPVAVVVMGVAGSGKSTVGAALAGLAGLGTSSTLTITTGRQRRQDARGKNRSTTGDHRRRVWDVAGPSSTTTRRGAALVLACSALRRSYDRLGVDGDRVRLVHLDVGRPELERRLRERAGHFMAVDMLGSQLCHPEVPDADEALVLDGVRPGTRAGPGHGVDPGVLTARRGSAGTLHLALGGAR